MSELKPLETAVLSVLHEKPMHPYEMYQLLIARAEDRLVKIRPGSLYHAVVRLAERGLLSELGRDREGNRPERTTYSLTETGRTALVEWVETRLAVPTNEYPEFPVAVAQMHNLPEAEVVAVLGRRLDALRAERDFHGLLIGRHTAIQLHEPYWLDTRYQHAMLAAQIDWIEQLLDDLQTGRIVWQDPEHAAPPPPGAAHLTDRIAHEGDSAHD